MDKDEIESRMSFSHARTKPVIVEKLKRRSATNAPLCPSCGTKMRLPRRGGSPRLGPACPKCNGSEN